MKFTDRALRALTAQPGERLMLSDDTTPGLMLRASAKSKTFYVDYRFRGKRHRTKLGRYPTVSLADARARARDIELAVSRGVNPAQRVQGEPTVADAVQRYETHLRTLKHANERRRALESNLASLWSSPITAVTRADLEHILTTKREEGKSANRVRAYLKAFFSWVATETMLLDGVPNPAASLSRPVKEKPRDRLLSVDEIRTIYKVAPDPVKLLILTAARRSETTQLRWSEVSDVITLAPGRTKTGKAHVIHLSAPATAIINAQHRGGPNDFVFADRNLNRVMTKLPKLDEPYRLHDFRRAFATAMSERGAPLEVVELCLGHSLARVFGNIAAVYNLQQRLPERAAFLDEWARVVTDA